MSNSFITVMISSLLLAACTKQGAPPASELQPASKAASVTTQSTVPTEPSASPTVAAPTEIAPLDEAQILHTLTAIDDGEIEQAKVALTRSKNARVQKFAQHMLAQHTKSQQRTLALAHKAAIAPANSEVSTRVTYEATAFVESLQTVGPTGFDSLYIGAQDAYHEHLLHLANKQLIPAASNAELKSLLAESVAMLRRHVAEAAQIEQELESESKPHTDATR